MSGLSPLANITTPNLADFQTFLTTFVQIPTAALPANSPYPAFVFPEAQSLVLNAPMAPSQLFCMATYNCATHLLFLIAPDQPGQTYFAAARSNTGFGLVQPSSGIVVSSSDQGTSASLAQPNWAAGLTVDQLSFMKTPWGREYLAYNQKYGPTIWGLT